MKNRHNILKCYQYLISISIFLLISHMILEFLVTWITSDGIRSTPGTVEAGRTQVSGGRV